MAASNKLDFLLAARAPGKRQVKLVPTEQLADFAAVGDEEDDLDYKAPLQIGSEAEGSAESGEEEDKSSDSASDGSSDGSDDEGEDGSSSSEDDDEGTAGEAKDAADDAKEDADTAAGTSSTDLRPAALVCSLCLNQPRPDGQPLPEVMECDGCGVAVHEGCYGVGEAESTHSNASSEETEPWFCEPCTLSAPPDVPCELCPNTAGPLKRMDKGSWVHLLCALYTPKVVFVDWDELSAVSTFEMGYREYGRSACAACEDALSARAGVATKCDAGMCKLSYHVTCAQRLGLLVDDSWKHSAASQDIAPADQRYLLCPQHSLKDVTRDRRRRYNTMRKQTSALLAKRGERTLTERERGKLEQKAWAARQRFSKLRIWTPSGEQRWARCLQHDPRMLRAMAAKAALAAGTSQAEFQAEFRGKYTAEMVGRLAMPLAFSQDFVFYYEERERVIARLAAKRRKLEEDNAAAKAAMAPQEAQLSKIDAECGEARRSGAEASAALRALLAALASLGAKVPKLAARPEPAASAPASPSRSAQLHACGKCASARDQHQLALCDSCQRHFHLGCLEPPLRKMPRKTALYGWECSDCTADREDGDEEEEEPDLTAPRSTRGRTKPVARLHNDPDLFRHLPLRRKRGRVSAKPAKDAKGPAAKRRRLDQPLKLELLDSADGKKRRGRPPKGPAGLVSPASLSSDSSELRKPRTKAEKRAQLEAERAASSSSSGLSSPARSSHASPAKASPHSPKASPQSAKRRMGASSVSKKTPTSEEAGGAGPLEVSAGPGPEASDEVEVATSVRRRMQYPLANLERAVEAVLAGKMGAKRAAHVFSVPRSTIGRRVSVHPSRAESFSGGLGSAGGKAPSTPSSSPALAKRPKGVSVDEHLRSQIASLVNGDQGRPQGTKEDWEEDESLADIAKAAAGEATATKNEIRLCLDDVEL